MKINLDTFTQEQLENFAIHVRDHPRTYAKRYFPGEKGNVKTIKALSHYCWNKATAMECERERKSVQEKMYLNICGKIYNDLPDYAKWRE